MITEEQMRALDLGKQAAVAFFIAIAGVVLLFAGGSPDTVTPDSLLYRRFGPEGAVWAARGIGALVALASGLWFSRCMRRLRALKAAREGSLPPFPPTAPR